MKEIILKNKSEDGKELIAIYAPENGMNLISYKKGECEVIDQSTKELFQQRNAGLGALIGPHFHRRHFASLPKKIIENPIPEILRLQKNNLKEDPFSHGIARYASWKFESDENSISAILKGNDLWNEIPLKELEGQDFTYTYRAILTPKGLNISLSIVSEFDSLVGIHYYYALPQKKGKVTSQVQRFFIDSDKKKEIPSDWDYNEKTFELNYFLDKETDFTFHPAIDATKGTILLDAETYQLKTVFSAINQECSWQLWHPFGSSFVCIEPISSQDPRHPNLTVSSLNIELEIIH